MGVSSGTQKMAPEPWQWALEFTWKCAPFQSHRAKWREDKVSLFFIKLQGEKLALQEVLCGQRRYLKEPSEHKAIRTHRKEGLPCCRQVGDGVPSGNTRSVGCPFRSLCSRK